MWPRLRSWLQGLASRRRVDRELADELAFHLSERTAHWTREGLDPAEAARRARLEFGTVAGYQEDCRRARGLRWIDDLRADARYGIRSLRSAPTFTIVAVATLAIAIGANIAIFSAIDAVMMRSLPVLRPNELREVSWIERGDSDWAMSYDGSMRPGEGSDRVATSFAYPVYRALRDRATSCSDVFLFTASRMTIGAAGRYEQAAGLTISGNFLRGLGIVPVMGRAIEPDDDRPGAPLVAMLTYGAWLRVFGGDAAAIGRTLTINGTPAVVIGVTPRTFDGVEPGSPVDVMVPITPALAAAGTADVLSDFHRWWFRVMARARPGVDDGRAQAEIEEIVRQSLPPELANSPRPGLRRVLLTPGGRGLDSLRHNYARPLSLLMAIAIGVLTIACANIAGLQLTRAAARDREMGLRRALGAGRGRLVRQLLTESALLAGLGGVAGLGLALALRSEVLPLLSQEDAPIQLALGIDRWFVAFAIGVCACVGIVCGMLSAWRAARGDLASALKSKLGGHAGRLFGGKMLIAIQVGLSLVLLVGAALFVRTLANLRAQPLGFRADHLLLFELDASASGYEGRRLLDFYARAADDVARLPGVRAGSMSRHGLLTGGGTRDTIAVSGASQGHDRIPVSVHFVAPRYFDTMGIELLTGRDFSDADREGARRTAIVNRALAELLVSGGMPIGRVVQYEGPQPDVEIVGVAADARFASLREPSPPTIYLPYRQYPQHRMTFALRVEGDWRAVVAPARRAIEAIDPVVPMFQVRTQEEQIADATRQERVFAYASSALATLAVLLACLGIYGTLAYAVSRRTSEIGVRMALGAARVQVVAMIVRESLAPVVAGVVAGGTAAWLSAGVLESMLFGVAPHDVPTLLCVTLGLLVSAIVAASVPARRASRIDPVDALRSE